jgi:protein-S-isoprenylcysteine O-methyltransferase Ste14
MEHGHEVMRDYPAPEIQTRGSRLRILVHCWARFRTATPRWIRAALYMVLVGGAWLVVVPLTLVHLGPPAPLPPVRTLGIAAAGLGLFLLGTVLALWAGYDLIVQGQGTPFPLDPTTDLVTRGAYRYVRNPQAIAMTLMVAGEVVALRAPRLWLTLPLLVVFLEGLARPWEDRQLLETYGACYVRYRERVPRWLPRRPSR